MGIKFNSYQEALNIQNILANSSVIVKKCGLINWKTEEERDPKTGATTKGEFNITMGNGTLIKEIVEKELKDKSYKKYKYRHIIMQEKMK